MLPIAVHLNEIALRTAYRTYSRRRRRVSTPEQVLDDYQGLRLQHLEEFLASDWTPTEYALREAEDTPGRGPTALTHATLLNGRAGTDFRTVRELIVRRLAATVGRYEPRTVVEAGSGTGRNLVYLAHELNLQGTGLELTPAGVAVGRAAADRFGLDLTFEVTDLTDPNTTIPTADVVYSVHALEQIPHAGLVVDKMVRAARKAVVMIEPFPDFWPGGLAGWAHRLRAEDMDRLQAGALSGHRLTTAQMLPFGTLLNRSIEVVIATQGS